MRDQFSSAQQIRKPAVVSNGGIVAAQSRKAAEVGAEVGGLRYRHGHESAAAQII